MKDLPATLIFDGHNDTLLELYTPNSDRTFFEESDQGQLDLPRARKGGMHGGLFAIFVPNDIAHWRQEDEPLVMTETNYEFPLPEPLELEYAQNVTNAILDSLDNIESQSNGQVKIVRTYDQLISSLADGTFAAVIHFEGADVIDTDLKALHSYYKRGLRSLGIVWSRPNDFGHGVPFKFPFSPDTGPGLTDAGKELVHECNRLGIMIDLAHINEKGFWDVANITSKPLVVSHSAAHTLSASARNLTDDQIDAIGESGGLIGITFFVGDLRSDGHNEPKTPVSEIARHTDYIAQRIGIDHVAFGSDFDGATIPEELRDVTGMPKVIASLREMGYDDTALRKVCHENWLRVLKDSWS
jgi:membrane dipeptidase